MSKWRRKDITMTNQVFDYNDSRDIPRLVIPRLENVDKTPKLNPRINLGISSDLGILWRWRGLIRVHKTN